MISRFPAVLVALVVALAISAGCQSQMTRRQIYTNLMTQEQADQFRQMQKDEVDEQKQLLYCMETGVWSKWHAVPPERQELIRKRQVVEGMAPDEVQMVWGRPAATEDITSAAEREEGHERLLWNYGERRSKDDQVSWERQVCLVDGKVEWIKDFSSKSWWNPFD